MKCNKPWFIPLCEWNKIRNNRAISQNRSESFTMKKWGDLQLALQLCFWIAITIYNSFAIHPYSTSVNVIKQVALWITHATHHMWNCIHIQLVQLSYKFQLNYNYCVIIIQLVCNYHANIMLTSFFINPSKSGTSMGIFWWFFFNINLHHPLYFSCVHNSHM